MNFRTHLTILFRQELLELIHSKFLWLVTFIYTSFFFIFVVVGMNESSILGFTGLNRVLFSWSHALVFFLPLLALATSATTITQYRENGSLEFFLSQPVSRKNFFLAMTLARVALLLLPLVVLLLITSGLGLIFEKGFSISYGVKFTLISSALIWCFLSLGFYISEKSRSQVRAIVMMILLWICSVVLMDFILIGLLLKFHFSSEAFFFLTQVNPIQAARLAMIIELDSALSTLGPVGFFIVNQIGELPVLIVGIFWPMILGLIFWWITRKNFIENDLI